MQRDEVGVMPIYEYVCASCKKKFEAYIPKPDNSTLYLCECGGSGEKIYSVYSPRMFEPFTTSVS